MLEDQPLSKYAVGDLVGHAMHDHLAGIILALEYVRYDTRDITLKKSRWKAWVEWNGEASTKDFVDCKYLIKLM